MLKKHFLLLSMLKIVVLLTIFVATIFFPWTFWSMERQQHLSEITIIFYDNVKVFGYLKSYCPQIIEPYVNKMYFTN